MYSRVYSGEKLAKSDKEKEKGGVYVQMGVWERKSCKSAGVCLLEGVLCVINPASLIPRVLSVWPTEPSAQAPSTPPGHESCLSHTVGVHTHTPVTRVRVGVWMNTQPLYPILSQKKLEMLSLIIFNTISRPTYKNLSVSAVFKWICMPSVQAYNPIISQLILHGNMISEIFHRV